MTTTETAPPTEPTTDPATAAHMLHVLDRRFGDSRTIWNPENQDEVDAAKTTFTTLKKRGYLAYKVDQKGEKGEVIQEFDPQAGRIIMSPPLVGG